MSIKFRQKNIFSNILRHRKFKFPNHLIFISQTTQKVLKFKISEINNRLIAWNQLSAFFVVFLSKLLSMKSFAPPLIRPQRLILLRLMWTLKSAIGSYLVAPWNQKPASSVVFLSKLLSMKSFAPPLIRPQRLVLLRLMWTLSFTVSKKVVKRWEYG